MRMEEQVLAIRPRKRSREHPDEHPIKGTSSTVVEVITNKGALFGYSCVNSIFP